VCFTNSKFADIQYLQNFNGQRLMVFCSQGGFMLFDGDDAVCTLEPEALEYLRDSGEIDFPRITEKEIQDRSKGDALSKGLVVIQTGWFLLQCIARKVERLPITELEVATLAFATLNFATYALWWHKPLNVQRPFHVLRKQRKGASEGEGADENANRDENNGDDRDVDEEWDMFKFEVADAIARERSTATVLPVVDTIVDPDAIMQGLDHIRSHDWSTIWSAALKYGIMEPIEAFVTMGYGEAEWEAGILMRVSTFYSGDSEDNLFELAGLCAAMIMGAIHCVAWSLQFPSHAEQLFWRIVLFP
jgi:hypothetical protein